MIAYLTKLGEIVLDILFPPVCMACNAHFEKRRNTVLCLRCENSIEINSAFTCPVCRARLPHALKVCHKEADYVLAAAASYDNLAIQALIWQLKFHRRTSAALALANLLSAYLDILGLDITDFIIIPIPLHRKKLRERGFNQVELIARELIKIRPIPTFVGIPAKVGDCLILISFRGIRST